MLMHKTITTYSTS